MNICDVWRWRLFVPYCLSVWSLENKTKQRRREETHNQMRLLCHFLTLLTRIRNAKKLSKLISLFLHSNGSSYMDGMSKLKIPKSDIECHSSGDPATGWSNVEPTVAKWENPMLSQHHNFCKWIGTWARKWGKFEEVAANWILTWKSQADSNTNGGFWLPP